ncbi:MAG: hypothetical protein DRH26_16995 [Deltaproteobacteria bacterium]|nr:MAG: hypothetical protein DRH26_16995 [Deltaproteobacteria bacterium]
MYKIKLICENCKCTFEEYKSRLKRPGRGRFCSRKCKDIFYKKGSTLVCALCNKNFYRADCENNRNNSQNVFCSTDCYFQWRKITMKGSTYPKIGAIHIHRIVAESIIGRKLTKKEVVHHKDGNRHNNHPSNIEIIPSQADHAKLHFTKKR